MRTHPSHHAAGSALLASLCAVAASCDRGGGDLGQTPDIYTVSRGDLRITVNEDAEIKSAVERTIKSEIEGQATVIYLIPEGTVVEKGERLVELDVSDLVDRRATMAIEVERAKALLVDAQQNMLILEKELAAEGAEARSALQIAEIDQQKFLGRKTMTEPVPAESTSSEEVPESTENGHGDPSGGGGGQQKGLNRDMIGRLEQMVAGTRHEDLTRKAIDLLGPGNLDRDMGEMAQLVLVQIDEIVLANSRKKLAEDTLGHSRDLQAKNYITRNELDKDQLEFDTKDSEVTRAWNELDLLVSYTLLKTKIDIELRVDNAGLGVEKVEASAEARRARERAELSSRESEHALADGRLKNFDEQLGFAEITAPNPGLVVYASQGDGRRGRETVEEGLSVHRRQNLIILPDLSKMVAELKVQEADVDMVHDGQPALVRVEASPIPLMGTVSRVSLLPDSGSRWSNNDLKVYKTTVTLEGDNRDRLLRPGMSAEVEIIIGVVRDALYVPVQAVRMQGAVHFVWKLTPEGPVARRVELGRNNLSHVVIAEGLAEGDRVYLAPPGGVEQPEFAQPEVLESDPVLMREDAIEGVETARERRIRGGREDETREGGPGDRGPGRGRGRAPSPLMTELREKIKERYPEYADQLDDPGAMFRNEELRSLIQEDPELSEISARMMAEMRSRGGGEGRGRGGRRGEGEQGGRRDG